MLTLLQLKYPKKHSNTSQTQKTGNVYARLLDGDGRHLIEVGESGASSRYSYDDGVLTLAE
ncbi:hypothetical protein MFMK1_001982 [Metallumcola ferriviriculae]|uniref:YD repeat-containing protein n=1 Tax=Metallumcola ferriviriculae TaxID=3039180 RepID=A0AAU0UP60_9FIRM|nr:hypothetical protein MFMK1_001982 [Desulfitibacteraceae bacterium MK1]